MSIPNRRGIYLLMINVMEDVKIYLKTGKEWMISRGIYYYVGSAKGPGGLRARINRHLRGAKKLHWHIDYLLTNQASIVTHVVYAETEKPECVLVPVLERLGATHIARGFGSSDCKYKCFSHLLRCNSELEKCLQTAITSFKEAGLLPVVMSVSI